MTHPHNLHELQEGMGQTGRFGELFVGLGILILLGGAAILAAGQLGGFRDGTSPDGGVSDSVQVGWLFFFEGLGFTMFGAMVMAAGWTRHHEDDSTRAH